MNKSTFKLFMTAFVFSGIFAIGPAFGNDAFEGASAQGSTPNLIQLGSDFKFQGLTQDGLVKIKQLRDALRQRHRVFDNQIRGLGALHHAGTIARCAKSNMFIYGPPGGAKSMFVKWFFEGEDEPAFQLQLHQMMTEQAFVGGQNFDKAKAGEFEVNTKGSLADFKVALIDEAEKGNPAALSALLSLLNEREILAGNRVVKAKTETVFATSNANLPEIFQHFMNNGQGTTAAAFLNRFQIKSMVYNWLSDADQALLDKRRHKARFMKLVAHINPLAAVHEIFVKPKTLDWDAMRLFTGVMFEPSALFMSSFREFMDSMRSETNRAVRESEEKHRANRNAEPFVYFPSFDFTERLRQQIPEMVAMSAMIDFLLSDLADDDKIEGYVKKTIQLGPLSLWRSYILLTTIGPGETKLAFDENSEISVDINFDFKIEESNARDAREGLLIRNLKDEQARFKRVFLQRMSKLQDSLKKAAKNIKDSFDADNSNFDIIELQMLQK